MPTIVKSARFIAINGESEIIFKKIDFDNQRKKKQVWIQ